jgi:biotin carboxylase
VAKHKGFLVGVVDRDPYAVGMDYADVCYQVSTTDIDGVLNVAAEFQPDGVFTLATDMPVRTAAVCASELGLLGISVDTAWKATDKGKMMECLKKHQIPAPWFRVVSSEEELNQLKQSISYPCVIKPVDSAGSRGVILVHQEKDLEQGFHYSKSASQKGTVIIEEYLRGHEVSVETMTIKGQTHVLAITDKETTGPPHFVEIGHTQPSILDSETKSRVEAVARSAVEAIGIDIGPAHVEIMVTEDGPKIIELGARLGGDFIATHLIPLSTGLDAVSIAIDVLTGRVPDITPKYYKGSAIRYLAPKSGVIEDIHGVEQAKGIPGVRDVSLMLTVGDMVKNATNSSERFGYVIAQGHDREAACRISNEAIHTIRIITR